MHGDRHERGAQDDVGDARDVWREIGRVATRQRGLIAPEQLGEAGLNRHRRRAAVRSGRLHRHGPGLFLVGHRHLDPAARLLVPLLRAGPGATLAGPASLVHWGLLARQGDRVEVLVPKHRRSKPGVIIGRRVFDERDVRERRAIRALAPLPALVDAAGRIAPGRLQAAVDEAAVQGMLRGRAVGELLARCAGKPGARDLRAALGELDPSRGRPTSKLERRWATFARTHELPAYERGGLIALGDGAELELTEMDVWFPHAGLLVELDGLAFHETGPRQARDRRRDRRLLAVGIPTVRATWADFDHHEAELLQDVLAGLALAPVLRRAALARQAAARQAASSCA